MTGTTHEVEPGYGFQEEFAVEDDVMGEGALGFTIVTLFLLVAVVFATVQWATFEGQQARIENTNPEVPAALREARAEADRKLTQYEVIDSGAGVYQIPIERAMALEARDAGNE